MEYDILKEFIDRGMSIRQISKKIGKSQTAIIYWAKKHGLKSTHSKFTEKEYGECRVCPRCDEEKEIKNFYSRRDKSGSSSYCKKCCGDQVLERIRKFKSLMIGYKGGECMRCGYKKYQGALEFHHINPEEKDFNPSTYKMNKFNDKIRSELDKCILVCSNCHKEIHNELVMEKYL